MNGGSGANTVTTKLLPDFAETSVKRYVTRAWNMANPKTDKYNIDALKALSTYAEWNSDEQEGIEALATRADDGSSIVQKERICWKIFLMVQN